MRNRIRVNDVRVIEASQTSPYTAVFWGIDHLSGLYITGEVRLKDGRRSFVSVHDDRELIKVKYLAKKGI